MKKFHILCIGLIIWFAYYSQYKKLGLYEDDYFFIAELSKDNFTNLFQLVRLQFVDFIQGRPLGYSFLYLAFFGAFKYASLHSLYLLSYSVFLLNAFLYYLLILKITKNNSYSLSGAVFYALFPADSTKILLTHLHIYPGYSLLLISFIFYLNSKKILSYLFAACSLLFYETIFPVFLVAPFLKNIHEKWDKKVRHEALAHLSIFFLILLFYVFIRLYVGESRVANIRLSNDLIFLIKQIIIGPIVCLYTYLQAFSLSQFTLAKLIVCICVFYFILSKGNFDSLVVETKNSKEFFIKLAFISILALVLSYALSIKIPAYSLTGRATRVHLPAVFGASLLMLSLFFLSMNSLNRNFAKLLTSVFFTFLFVYAQTVQSGFVSSWITQKNFWQQVLPLIEDVSDNTVVLLENQFPSERHVYSYPWSLPLVLSQIFKFPSQWKFPPRLYRLNENWKDNILSGDKFLLSNKTNALYYYFNWEDERLVESTDMILLKMENGSITRISDSIEINGVRVNLKQKSDPVHYNKNILHDLVIDN